MKPALHICVIIAITEPTIINANDIPIIALCHLPLPFSFLPLFFFTINYLYTLTFLISLGDSEFDGLSSPIFI
jgi:uncharacterized membrane protein YvlD (DUF360 family)